MSNPFFDQPILNSPYGYPAKHWELDESGQPTQRVIETRRRAEFITPIPKPRRQRGNATQEALIFAEAARDISAGRQKYDHNEVINAVRSHVDVWRKLPNQNDWGVTPATAVLLLHWRSHQFADVRPFFCQIEAAETAIWLIEVAPNIGKRGQDILDHLKAVNAESNPELMRIALKLATGAGKTTVMAMLIAWQTINATRHPGSKKFSRGFLVVAPGLTIKDRLRVLNPSDPDSYYAKRELVPASMLDDIKRAKIVITNYHAFRLRERLELSAGGRRLLEGRGNPELNTLESEGQMIQRVMPDLMGLKDILVINDEAHHCYRERVKSDEEVEELKGDEKEEAAENNMAARMWISGLEAVQRKLGITRVLDLSATPFFLRGSGYSEGTLFGWTMCDFSLMDAIECGIVKLPRVPVAQNIDTGSMPMFRNLWENIRSKMPKKGRGKGGELNPLDLPVPLQTALSALYGHYAETHKLWMESNVDVPPCFIVVCNNTSTSKLVYDYISGFHRPNEDGSLRFEAGRLDLFSNFDEHGNALPLPRTLLIDSEQLESGEALDDSFRSINSDAIERFKRERVERSGNREDSENFTDQELLREVMNTVGKPGQLGAGIRCVVSVSMLTEGWDANTVTHVLGVRAFGTQLLCEQVVGRALRRLSYKTNAQGLFNVEYADVLGIPFDFAATPVQAKPQAPAKLIQVRAMRPERDAFAIRFPRIQGYRVELPNEMLTATFGPDSILELTPKLVGASITRNEGIVGEGVDLTLAHTADTRYSTVVWNLTNRLLMTHWRDKDMEPRFGLFGQLKRITRNWLDECLVCKGDTYPAQLLYKELEEMACERISAAITASMSDRVPIRALLDPYNPVGSTEHVNFNTTKDDRWLTDARKCHVNWVVLDSGWEAEFCRAVESHPQVFAYCKNHGLGFDVPYQLGGHPRTYRPDFLVKVDDGRGTDDLLNLIVEIKGYRNEDAKVKKNTMETYWVPGVNALGEYGRWAFAEFVDSLDIDKEMRQLVANAIAESNLARKGA